MCLNAQHPNEVKTQCNKGIEKVYFERINSFKRHFAKYIMITVGIQFTMLGSKTL